MRNIIFLDIDGVLNCSETPDRCCGYRGIESAKVALLAKLVYAMDAEVVLSSTWRGELIGHEDGKYCVTELGAYLLNKLAEYDINIDDVTPEITWSQRAAEVKQYLDHQLGIDKVLILDDEDFNYGPWGLGRYWYCTCDPFYFGDGPGLTEKDVDEILNNLDKYTYIDMEE